MLYPVQADARVLECVAKGGECCARRADLAGADPSARFEPVRALADRASRGYQRACGYHWVSLQTRSAAGSRGMAAMVPELRY